MLVLVSLGPQVPWKQHRRVQVNAAHPVVLHDNYQTVRLGNSPFLITKSQLFVLEGNITSSFKVAHCKYNLEKWPRWTVVRVLHSLYSHAALRAHSELPFPTF